MRGGGQQRSRIYYNKGNQEPVYEPKLEDPALLKLKYPPLSLPQNAFSRLLKKKPTNNTLSSNSTKAALAEFLDIENIENEILKCLNESTTKRLYQPSEQVPLNKQKQFRTKFVSVTHIPNLSFTCLLLS